LRTNSDQQSRYTDLRDRLEQQLASVTAEPGVVIIPGTGGAAATSGATQLSRLRQELAALRQQFTDEHPDVIRLRTQVATLERQAPADTGTVPAEVQATGRPATQPDTATRLRRNLADAEAQLATLREEETMLRQSITTYESRIESAPRLQQQFEQLSSDYDASKERYATLLKRYEEAQLANDLEQGQNVEQFRILDAAIPPNGPAAPNRNQLLLMALAGAFGLAFASVVAAERLDTTFHRVEDLRAFVSVPTIATIHLIPTRLAARRRHIRFALITLLVLLGTVVIVGGAHYFALGNEGLVRLVARF
jgi:uncharacterized protein involved in exopolysaccharide biosynthesis